MSVALCRAILPLQGQAARGTILGRVSDPSTAVIPSGHLYYFTAETLGALLRSIGFSGVVQLTKPASFEEDLRFARQNGKLRMDDAAMEELKARLLSEDADKVSNGWREGLVLCAQKPMSGGVRASRKAMASMTPLEGKLIKVSGNSGFRVAVRSCGVNREEANSGRSAKGIGLRQQGI